MKGVNEVDDAGEKVFNFNASVPVTEEEITAFFNIDLATIKTLDVAKQVIQNIQQKAFASRQDLQENYKRLAIMSELLREAYETVERTNKTTLALVADKTDMDRATTKILEQSIADNIRSREAVKELAFKMLLEAKDQITGAYSKMSYEMRRVTLDLHKFAANDKTITKILIPLARHYQNAKIGASGSSVYMDLTRPDIPEGEANKYTTNALILAEYEYGIKIEFSPEDDSFESFVVYPEFASDFDATKLTFNCKTFDEVITAVDFVRSHLELEILKYVTTMSESVTPECSASDNRV